MAHEGQLNRGTLVWREGMADWQAAGSVLELSGGSRAASVPAPAPTPPPLSSTEESDDRDFDPRFSRAPGYAGEHFDAQQNRVSSLIMLLWLLVAAQALMVVLGIYGMLAFDDWNNAPINIAGDELMLRLMMGGLGLGYTVGFIIVVVLFCMWANRANRNARALGAIGMAFTPGWTVGWFFIPIANLWKPYQAIKEVYQASKPDADGSEWRGAAVANVVGQWWALWVANNLLGMMTTGMVMTEDPEMVAMSVWLSPLSLVLWVAATYMLIQVIKSIQQRQLDKASRVLPELQRDRY
jgi:hypothetical protein